VARSMRSAAAVLALVAVILTALGGCGLRSDENPEPIPRERLDELFREGAGASGGTIARIYVFTTLDGGALRLVGQPVQVQSNTGSGTPGNGTVDEKALLQALVSWVPPTGQTRLTTLIPFGTTLRDVRREGNGVLTVDLGNMPIEGPAQVNALAQIVFTATDIPGVSHVRFLIDGQPASVPLAAPSARLSRKAFPGLEQEQGPAPSTTAAPAGTDAPPEPPRPPEAPPPETAAPPG
jgi:hypothetical protein